MYISDDDIQALHQRYAPSPAAYSLIYTHCRIVCDIALQLIEAEQLDVDRQLVHAGALLHDIGAYPLFGADGRRKPGTHYIQHGLEGESILKDEDFPEALWRIASHHTGVGLTAEDIRAQRLPLPEQDFLAETDEERLIMYADKFHSKSLPPRFNSYESYRKTISGFGPGKAEAFDALAARFGKPDLKAFSAMYGHPIA